MRRIVPVAVLVLATACTPVQMLRYHRASNPDGPYRVELCQSPAETGTDRWRCSYEKVRQLRREASRLSTRTRAASTSSDLIWHWAGVAECESGGNPAAHNPSGQYHGAYQFTLGTWQAYGGTGDPHTRSLYDQTVIAERVRQASGLGSWPVCGSRYR